MNETVARAIVTLLSGLVNPLPAGSGGPPVCSDELRDALAILADAAHHQLGTGPGGDSVRAAWPTARPIVMTSGQQERMRALAAEWSPQPDALTTAPTGPGEGGPHDVPDEHEAEAAAAAEAVRRDVAEMLVHVGGGLPGLVRALDEERADVLATIEHGRGHDPVLIGQLGALSACREAIAELLPGDALNAHHE